MFTGIIAEQGTVLSLELLQQDAILTLKAPQTSTEMKHGASLAVNGVCLSALSVEGDTLTMEIMGETLQRTNLGELKKGEKVNLELPLRANAFLDGHIVQGHVDGVGKILKRTEHGPWETVCFEVPENLAPYIAEKGSIAIDGTSLTVTAVSKKSKQPQWFEVALIPLTREENILGTKKIGSSVNFEVDIVAKYVERLAGQ
ncbi:MAG: riboflavin synthase [Micrococcaceae bacterium]